MAKKCYFMNCDVDEDEPTLEELSKVENESISKQAKILIEKFKFPKDAVFCDDCFWK